MTRGSGIFTSFVRSDPVAVVGILLSVALSLTLDVTNAATGVESLLTGLVGSTLALVLDSMVRAERRFQLRKVIEAAPWFGDAIYPAAEHTRQIVWQYPDSLLVAEAQQGYRRLREDLAELSRGRIERDGSDYQYLIEPTRRTQNRMEAVTNIVPEAGDVTWWRDGVGRRYWEQNLAAIARGVQITRIFTYLELTPELDRLIEEQQAAGVEVIAVPRGAVPETLQMNFVVWDGRHAWEARLNTRGVIIGNVYTANEHDVSRLRGSFQRLSLAISA